MAVQNMAPERNGDVVLGDDFVAPRSTVDENIRARRERRGFFLIAPLTVGSKNHHIQPHRHVAPSGGNSISQLLT